MLELLHNETVAPVTGGVVTALATYFVVAFTDSRRLEHKARKRVPTMLAMYKYLLGVRIEGADNANNSVMMKPRIRDTGDRFPVETIRLPA